MNQLLHFIILTFALNISCSKEKKNDIEILKEFVKSKDYKPVTVLLSSKNQPAKSKQEINPKPKEIPQQQQQDNLSSQPKAKVSASKKPLPYNYDDDGLKDAYNKVMNKLDPSRQNGELDYRNKNFLEKLVPIVNEKQNQFPANSIFWSNLNRLLLKTIFYSGPKYLDFKTISKAIQSLNSILVKNFPSSIKSSFNLDNLNLDDFNSELLESEFLEHSERLSSIFIDALNYIYSPLFHIEKEKESLNVNCFQFRFKFLNDGIYNDILLALFMNKYDVTDGVLRLCLKKYEKYGYHQTANWTISKDIIEKVKNNIKGLESKGIEHFIKSKTISLSSKEQPLKSKEGSKSKKIPKPEIKSSSPKSKTKNIETKKSFIYDYNDESFKDAYNVVMIKLDLLKEKNGLNHLDKDFLEKLAPIINEKKAKFPYDNVFWLELNRLLLKNILYLSQLISFNAEKISKTIQSINSIIKEKSSLFNEFNLDLKNIEIEKRVPPLLAFEFIEHSNRLSSSFAAALEYVYSSHFNTKKENNRVEINYDEFYKEFLGHYYSTHDILLKLFMIKYDIEPIKNCLKFSSSIELVLSRKDIESIKADIDGLKSKGVEYFINFPNIDYMTNSALTFISSRKNRVLIEIYIELYIFLKRMDAVGSLKKELIEAVIGFKDSTTNPNGWDLKLFESYLGEYKNSFDRREFVNKCLGLFNLKPLEKKSFE